MSPDLFSAIRLRRYSRHEDLAWRSLISLATMPQQQRATQITSSIRVQMSGKRNSRVG